MFPCITNVLKQSARAVRQHARVRQGLLLPRRLADEPRQEVRGLVGKIAPYQTEKPYSAHEEGKSTHWEAAIGIFAKTHVGLKQSLPRSFPLWMLNEISAPRNRCNKDASATNSTGAESPEALLFRTVCKVIKFFRSLPYCERKINVVANHSAPNFCAPIPPYTT